MVDIAYYTCLNNECYKYRGIFMEGDPEHANCERARLFPEERAGLPAWMWFAVPAAVALVAGAAMMFMRRRSRSTNMHMPPMGERRTETWSGSERITDERKSHAAPPPIVPDTRS
jgi:hypothetical protein